MRRTPAIVLAACLFAATALAVEPDEILDDPVLEARARALSQELRCLVCQNQSIDDSNAGLARDLRLLVRERLEAGDSDDEVIAFVTARYGDYVLLDPPLKPATLGLWFGPLALLLIAAAAILIAARRRTAAPAPKDLTAAERARIEALLAERRDKTGDK